METFVEGIDKMAISDDKLFADPPPKEDCPICMLPMPHANGGICNVFKTYMPCCGKTLCSGCMNGVQEEIKKGNMKRWCAYCRLPLPRSENESIKRIKKRIKLNDAEAFNELGNIHRCMDTSQDWSKALKLYSQAANLGLTEAHVSIGYAYQGGNGCDVDKIKAMYHMEVAAIGGHVVARYGLAWAEEEKGNMKLAMKHYMIAAKSGFDAALKAVGLGYKAGYVTKDEYASALRAHKDTRDEMKSDQRTKAWDGIRGAAANRDLDFGPSF